MLKFYKYIYILFYAFLLSIPISFSSLYATDTSIRTQINKASSNKQIFSKISSILNKSIIYDIDKGVNKNAFVKIDKYGYLHVYLCVYYIDDTVLSILEDNKFIIEIINKDLNIIQGWIYKDDLIKISGFDFVKEIKPPVYGILRQGSITTEGDTVLNSDIVREDLGITGQGVRVGVISDGIDSKFISQSTGDLPDNICVVDSGDGDEGTALLETIHDIAPGAALSFSEGFSSSLAFIKSIDDLINICDVDVIVDDVGFLLEPYFQDGAVAQKVDEAVSKGIIFISSAGNSADEHYQNEYFDENTSNNEFNLHDFGQASQSQSALSMPILVGGNQFSPNNFIAAILQWNDPIGLSNNDYDLFLFDENGVLLDSSIINQNGNDDPVEVVIFENNTDEIMTVHLVINKFNGDSKILELNFNGIIFIENFNVPEDSIFGHPAAEGAITVAAVPFFNPDKIEDFSSRGPVSIIANNSVVLNGNSDNNDFFTDTKAVNLFVQRQKPTLTGIDGTSTSLADFTPFFGTSVAAPHIAGVIALILDAAPILLNSGLNTTSSSAITRSVKDIDSILDILRNTSIDLGPPGDDTTFGFGRVDALAAVEEALERFGGDDGGNNGVDPPDNNQNDNNNSSSGGGCKIIEDGRYVDGSLINLFLIASAVFSIILVRKLKHSKRF